MACFSSTLFKCFAPVSAAFLGKRRVQADAEDGWRRGGEEEGEEEEEEEEGRRRRRRRRRLCVT
jgi:hypothetical protein